MRRAVFTRLLVLALVGCAGPSEPTQVQSPNAEAPQVPPADVADHEGPAHLPEFLRKLDFTCSTFAEAVNHYIALGEDKGVAALNAVAALPETDWGTERAKMRVAFLCRVLFEPRGNSPLRAPRFGGLMLPWNTMPLESWPQYPVACVGSSCFILNESYTLAGVAERTTSYLTYCCTEGRYRTSPIPVPSWREAVQDLNTLRSSKRWEAIKWTDSGLNWSYSCSEDRTLEYLDGQTWCDPRRTPGGS